jgi:hypothetical protein
LEEMVEYLLSPEGGASIAETDDEGNAALLLAVGRDCYPSIVQRLLEHGDAQIMDTNNNEDLVWTAHGDKSVPCLLIDGDYLIIDGEYTQNGDIVEMTAMLHVMVLA